jgi:DNA repair protein RecO (recombination protein O)
MTEQVKAVYVLHTRDYRETSLLINLFSREQGRIDAVLNGGKGKKWRGVAREFSPLFAFWNGRGELKTLTQLEQASMPHSLTGDALLSGLYVNELIQRLLPVNEPHPDLFDQYCVCLDGLAGGTDVQAELRRFEWQLLTELGYQLDCHRDAFQSPIEPSVEYSFHINQGFVASGVDDQVRFLGSHILALAENNLTDKDVRRAAKILMREALAPLLGNKPLKSRALFKRDKTE